MAPSRLVHTRLLDVLFTIAVGFLWLTCLDLLLTNAWFGATRVVAGFVVGVVLVALWVGRRLTRRTGFTVAFAIVSIGAAYVTDNILGMLSVFCAVLILTLDIGAPAGVVFIGLNVVAQAVTMWALTDSTLDNVVLQTVGSAAVLAFIGAFALLLQRSAQATMERDDLLAERDRVNERLAEANRRLQRSLESEKDLVLAEERARSARELHDGLGHRLTVAGMSLDFASRSREINPDRAWKEVDTARGVLQEAMSEMRLWVRALNPVSVEGLRGVVALEAVAESFRGTGLDVRFEASGAEFDVPHDVVLFCHRFVQEGLTNAVRHARASTVWITVARASQALIIAVRDDGRGGGGAHEPAPGFGLRSLADRARGLGGEFRLTHTDGFEIRAEIPLTAHLMEVPA